MGNYLSLTLEYFQHFREIGSLVPDSPSCCRTLLRGVPFDTARTIYEYGAGSGRLTREILRRKRPDALLVAFEKNRNLYRKLKQNCRDGNFFLVNTDLLAGEPPILLEEAAGRADCIVSTLPCSSLDFDRLVREAVLPRLAPGGVFVQYAHTISALKGFRARKVLDRYFREVNSSLSLLNLPPAVIYTCRSSRQGLGPEATAKKEPRP